MVGTTVIEVLVSLLVLGIGTLGVAALQATALRNSRSALERSQAVIAGYAIIDAMRANRSVARAGGYDIDRTCVPPAPGDLVANDHRAWLQGMQASLGDGACGTIACAATQCTVTVTWGAFSEPSGSPVRTVITQTRL